MKHQLAFAIFISLLVGIFIEDLLHLPSLVVIVITLLGLLALGSVFIKKNHFIIKHRFFSLCLFFTSLGITLHALEQSKYRPLQLPEKETITFKITQKLRPSEKYKKYEIKVFQNNQTLSAIAYFPKETPDLDFMHYYQSLFWIKKVDPPQHYYQFDYAKYLERQGIYYLLFLQNQPLRKAPKKLSFSESIKQKRLDLLNKINQSPLRLETKSFLKGIILADKTELSSEVISGFRDSGLAHILAISGTHIGILFGFIFYIFKKILPARLRNVAIFISLSSIWCFAYFIGCGNSVLRACIMLSMFFGFFLLERPANLLDSLAISGLIIVCCDTQQVFHVGFQLSFAAVLGIYWLYQPLLKIFPHSRYSIINSLYQLISISLAAQASTFPLVALYFHQFSAIAIFANILVLPFVGIIIIYSFILSFLISIGLNSLWLFEIYNTGISFFLKIIIFLGKIPFGVYKSVSLNLLEFLAYIGIIYYSRFLIMKRNWVNFRKTFIAICLFLGIKLSSDYYIYQKEEILWHKYHNQEIFSIKKGSTIYFWLSSPHEITKVKKNIISPYLIANRTHKYKILLLPSETSSILFQNKTYHKTLNNNKISTK